MPGGQKEPVVPVVTEQKEPVATEQKESAPKPLEAAPKSGSSEKYSGNIRRMTEVVSQVDAKFVKLRDDHLQSYPRDEKLRAQLTSERPESERPELGRGLALIDADRQENMLNVLRGFLAMNYNETSEEAFNAHVAMLETLFSLNWNNETTVYLPANDNADEKYCRVTPAPANTRVLVIDKSFADQLSTNTDSMIKFARDYLHDDMLTLGACGRAATFNNNSKEARRIYAIALDIVTKISLTRSVDLPRDCMGTFSKVFAHCMQSLHADALKQGNTHLKDNLNKVLLFAHQQLDNFTLINFDKSLLTNLLAFTKPHLLVIDTHNLGSDEAKIAHEKNLSKLAKNISLADLLAPSVWQQYKDIKMDYMASLCQDFNQRIGDVLARTKTMDNKSIEGLREMISSVKKDGGVTRENAEHMLQQLKAAADTCLKSLKWDFFENGDLKKCLETSLKQLNEDSKVLHVNLEEEEAIGEDYSSSADAVANSSASTTASSTSSSSATNPEGSSSTQQQEHKPPRPG